jgi:hypothetical protein
MDLLLENLFDENVEYLTFESSQQKTSILILIVVTIIFIIILKSINIRVIYLIFFF